MLVAEYSNAADVAFIICGSVVAIVYIVCYFFKN